LLNQQKKFNRP